MSIDTKEEIESTPAPWATIEAPTARLSGFVDGEAWKKMDKQVADAVGERIHQRLELRRGIALEAAGLPTSWSEKE